MNVFDLQAVLGLDKSEYDRGLDDAQNKAGGFGQMFSGAFGTAIKVGTAAVGAASVAVGKLATDAVSSYASYEQLSGGVEKLFGVGGKSIEEYAESVGMSVEAAQASFEAHNNAVDKLMQNADNAWRTSGMSANEYMETATSFSAALINSLGGDTEKAAEMADIAMRAMSDNVNTFGSDAEAVSNAIMGLSRNNYTMIDNLKLGYAGTAEGMMKLVNDSGVLKDKVLTDTKQLSEVGFGTMIEAIQAIQEKQGIAGTTAREAMHTIEGSATATKKAWENVIIAIGKGEGIDSAFDNLLTAVFGDESGGGLLANIIPRIQTVMQGIATFIVSAAPQLSKAIPELINAVFPSLLSSAISLVGMLAGQLPSIVMSLADAVIEGVHTVLSEVSKAILGYDMFDDLSSFMDGIMDILSERIPNFVSTGVDWLIGLFQGFGDGGVLSENISLIFESILIGLSEGLPQILEKGIELITFFVNGLLESYPSIIATIGDILNQLISFIMENMPMFMEQGISMVTNLANGLLNNAPTIISTMVDVILSLIENILNHLPDFLEKGIEIIKNMIDGFVKATPDILKTMLDLIVEIIGKIAEKLPEFLTKGGEIIGQLIKGIVDMIPDVVKGAWDIINSIFDAFADVDWLELGSQVVNGLVGGLANGASAIWNAATDAASNAFDAACDFLGINSPSKLGRYIGRMFDAGIAEDIEDNAPVDEAMGMVKDVYDSARNAMQDIDIPINASVSSDKFSGARGYESNPIYAILSEYLPMLANMKMYINSGELVGALAPSMNEELGRIASLEALQ